MAKFADLDNALALAHSAVNNAIEHPPSDDIPSLIRHFYKVRELAERAKELRTRLYNAESFLSTQLIPDTLRANDVKTITVDGIGEDGLAMRVSVSHRYACSMPDKQAGFQYLREAGDGGLITETVNSSSLAAYAKNKLQEEGVELPPELFKVSINPFTSLTKVK